MKKILSVILLLTSVLAFSQPGFMWTKQIGGKVADEGEAIAVDAAGNVITAGNVRDTLDADPGPGTQTMYGNHLENVYINKLNASGNLIWAKRISSIDGGYVHVEAMTVDASSNITFSGYFTNTVDFNPGTGTFTVEATGTTDGFVCRLDANGNFLWVKTIGGSGMNGGTFIKDMTLNRKGDVLLTGSFKSVADFNPEAATYTMSARGNGDAFVCKLDSVGSFKWAQQIGDTGYFDVNTVDDCGARITCDAGDNIYVAGTFESHADFDGGPSTYTLQPSSAKADIFLLKLTSTGGFLWARHLPGPDLEMVNALTASNTGEIYLTGLFEASIDVDPGPGAVVLNATTLPNSWYDVFILKLDANGIYAWSKQLTGDKTKTANGLYVDNAGKLLLTGTFYETVDFDPSSATYTLTSTSATNIYILQLDASGNFMWVYQMGGVFSFLSDKNTGKAITCDASGNIYTTGKFAGTGDMDPTAGTYSMTTVAEYPDMYITKIGAPVGLFKQTLSEEAIHVYPNPTNGMLKVKQQTTNAFVKVYNVLGAEVMNSGVTNNEINLGALPKGVYFVELTNGTSVITRKIIKE